MPVTPDLSYWAILGELHRCQVDFIVVGGVAAVLEGVPLNTLDLDIVHSRAAGNIARLLSALDALDATYRTQPSRKLKPDRSHLLTTRFGPLDVLGSIGRSRTYEDLLPHTVEIDLGNDLSVRVLNLETLIAIKEEVGGEKDLAVLPVMRRTLAEKRRL